MICLKIRTFVVSATTHTLRCKYFFSCDLLENSYLCGISNNLPEIMLHILSVVICLKIRTFVVSATTRCYSNPFSFKLWFAWKFVPLWYQQQHEESTRNILSCCDLLENSYLCGISNNARAPSGWPLPVVICLKIRTFVVSATTWSNALTPVWSCDLLENSYLCGISNNQ